MLSTSFKRLLLLVALSLPVFAQFPTNIDLNAKGSRWPSFGTESGSGNSYVVTTVAPLAPTLRAGSTIQFFATHTNSGSATLNVDGAGAKTMQKWVAGVLTNLAANDITSGQAVYAIYDGSTNFQVTTFGGMGGSGTGAGATYRTCTMIYGADNGPTLVNADIGPQGRQCIAPYNATIVEVEVAADAGTPSVLLAVNHQGTQSNILSSALSTAGSGGVACSNGSGGVGFDGVTTCSSTLQNTSVLQGDYVEAVSGTASSAHRLSVFVTWSQPGAGSGGTVTSVGLTCPNGTSCSGSPVTSAGSVGFLWNVAGSDQFLISTGANDANWATALSSCGDSTHALGYDAAITHNFFCQSLSGGGGGGVSSFTGDGTLITNSASTGAVTATLGTAGAHKWWGNNTGSTATPGYQSIGTSDLPGSGSTTVNGATCTLGSSCSPTPAAISLSPTPSLCSAGFYARGIDANGNATGCTASTGGTTSGLRQTASIGTVGQGPFSVPLPFGVGSGDTVFVACAAWTGNAITISAPTDVLRSTWTLVGNTGLNTNDFNSEMFIYSATMASAGPEAVQCNITGAGTGGHLEMGIVDYPQTLSVDTSSLGNVANSTSGNARSVTTSFTDTFLVFVFTADGNTDVYSGLSSYTLEAGDVGVSSTTFRAYDLSSVASGAHTVTITGTLAKPQHAALIAIH